MSKLGRRLRLFLYLAVFAAITTLALWPVAAEGASGDPEAARACGRTLGRLASTVQRGDAAQGILTETEINAHLARILAHNPDARVSRGLRLGLRDLRVDLEPGVARLFVVSEIVGVPFTVESRFSDTGSVSGPLRLESLRVGWLPLVQPVKWLAEGRLESLLDHLDDERTVLGSLTSVAVTSNQALVVVGPRMIED